MPIPSIEKNTNNTGLLNFYPPNAPDLNIKVEVPNLKTYGEVLNVATKSGIAGAIAISPDVLTLMWIRTTVNFQYRYGCSYLTAIGRLYKDGGFSRFYRGLTFALIQGPLTKFGQTASNTGSFMILNNDPSTKDLSVGAKTTVAMVLASFWRVLVMPVDTCKTTMQVTGSLKSCRSKFKKHGVTVLFNGSIATVSSTFISQFPWFFTFNFLFENIPRGQTEHTEIIRRGFIGFCASVCSDLVSNSFRVVKVYKQSHLEPITYPKIVQRISSQSGWGSLFFRGFATRILANGIQGICFSILWKATEEHLFDDEIM